MPRHLHPPLTCSSCFLRTGHQEPSILGGLLFQFVMPGCIILSFFPFPVSSPVLPSLPSSPSPSPTSLFHYILSLTYNPENQTQDSFFHDMRKTKNESETQRLFSNTIEFSCWKYHENVPRPTLHLTMSPQARRAHGIVSVESVRTQVSQHPDIFTVI